MIKPSTRVYRKQIVDGVSIPAIIHNGHYFFVDLHVYEDGRVECWDFEDFEHFKKKVNNGWVVLNIPDNNEISVHGLGIWIIVDGNWTFTSKSFVAYVLSLIKEMNPHLKNIFEYTEKKVNGIRIGENGKGTIYKHHKDSLDSFPEKVNADCVDLFYKSGDEYWLVKVNVFADDTICLSRLEAPLEITFTELERLIIDKVVLTEVPDNAKIHIYGLGSFKIKASPYTTKIKDKLLEIKDIQRKLRGEPSSIAICQEAYEQYLQNPIPEKKEKLKISYENVPDHQKRYVGDMDTKDIKVRMILYGEQEIEKWSHYKIAKARGEDLPTIIIPTPSDKIDKNDD